MRHFRFAKVAQKRSNIITNLPFAYDLVQFQEFILSETKPRPYATADS